MVDDDEADDRQRHGEQAPIGPQIQVQNASARNISSGLSVIRRPTMVGVMK